MAEKNADATKAVRGGDHDRVVQVSRKADGTPDQTPDFEIIGDKEFAEAAAKEQLRQMAVSAVDTQERGVTADDEGSNEPDPSVKKLIDAHESAAKQAERAAVAEVKDRHNG